LAPGFFREQNAIVAGAAPVADSDEGESPNGMEASTRSDRIERAILVEAD
jgi:hypothetical protein